MSDPRREYVVKIGGLPHRILLTPDEAERRGLTEAKAAPASKNKARQPRNKEG